MDGPVVVVLLLEAADPRQPGSKVSSKVDHGTVEVDLVSCTHCIIYW